MLGVCCLILPAVLGTETNSTTTTSQEMEMELHHSVPSKAEVWGYGLLMVTVISLASVAGVVVMPIMSKTFYSSLMTGLIGLAVGSLAASSVFHLLPGAYRDPPQIRSYLCIILQTANIFTIVHLSNFNCPPGPLENLKPPWRGVMGVLVILVVEKTG